MPPSAADIEGYRLVFSVSLGVLFRFVSGDDFGEDEAIEFLRAYRATMPRIRRTLNPQRVRVTRRSAFYASMAEMYTDLIPGAQIVAEEILSKIGGNTISLDDATKIVLCAGYHATKVFMEALRY